MDKQVLVLQRQIEELARKVDEFEDKMYAWVVGLQAHRAGIIMEEHEPAEVLAMSRIVVAQSILDKQKNGKYYKQPIVEEVLEMWERLETEQGRDKALRSLAAEYGRRQAKLQEIGIQSPSEDELIEIMNCV